MPTSLHPILAASDGPDLQQIIYVVVFLVLAFVQWIYKMWQEKREQAERNRKPPPSAEELEAKRRAWQQQAAEQQKAPPPMPAGRQSPAPPLPAPMPVPQQRPASSSPAPAPTEQRPGSLGDLIDTFRKAMEEQARPQPPAPASAPPPLRTQPAAPVPVPTPPLPAATASRPSVPTSAPVHSYDVPAVKVHAMNVGKQSTAHNHQKKPSTHPLTEYLRTTGGYRKAFILKEVLDAPKALQKSPWPVD